jgi:hypothetical protein
MTPSRTVFFIRDTAYTVTALLVDPTVTSKAYRLEKHGGDGAVYDVHVTEHGPHCECLGFLRWHKPCKHIRELQVAGMI